MNLLLTGAFKYTSEQIDKLSNLGYDITFVQDERNPFECDCSSFDAVVCNALFLYTSIEKFTRLKFVQATSAGLDRIPVQYIKEKGIILKNAKGVYSVPMAEWCICKILEVYKCSIFFGENQKQHKWEKNRHLKELSGKTAVIVGAGDIGTQIAKRLCAFDVNVLAVDIVKPKLEYYNCFYDISEIDKALKISDIVIITLPLTDSTKNLFDKKLFEKMKAESMIINMSRGGIINEDALVWALNNNKIAVASLDVFEKEPLTAESKLWETSNLFISPHNSFVSENNNKRLFNVIYKNLESIIKNREVSELC
ncbi:MAG: NAD(P)-dependent oxidoreductase [Acutalibacteraceae bacterium]|nr:NAD(P)-dependent oxidoreductase [Acutalibacteraceae bacterium]